MDPLAGLFYGLGVRSDDRYDSFSESHRVELDGEECKATVGEKIISGSENI